MGWLARRRAAKDAQRAQNLYQAAMLEWTAVDDALADFAARAKTFEGGIATDTQDLTLQVKGDERVFAIVQNCGLVVARRSPGSFQGGSQGFSFPVGKTGIRYRVGGTRGTFTPGVSTHPSSTPEWSRSPTDGSCSRGRFNHGSGSFRSCWDTSTSMYQRGQPFRCPIGRRRQESNTTGARPPRFSSGSSLRSLTFKAESNSSLANSRQKRPDTTRNARSPALDS